MAPASGPFELRLRVTSGPSALETSERRGLHDQVPAGAFYYTVQDTAGAQQTAAVSIAISPASSLAVIQNTTSWNGGRSFGTPWNSTGPVTVSASGGSGNYKFEWERVQGPDQNSTATPASVDGGTTISSNWTRAFGGANVYQSTWRCKVTDKSTLAVGYSQNISVVFEIES